MAELKPVTLSYWPNTVSDPRFVAREALLNLFAEASRFEEDCDGETFPDGHRTFSCNYHLTVPYGALSELLQAVGLKVRFDELPGDAIKRALSKP